MKLTDVHVRFIPDKRPEVIVEFDRTVKSALEDAVYDSRFHKDTGTWLFRADVGHYVFCGAQFKNTGAARIRTVYGTHHIGELHLTNGPAVNALFTDLSPVMDVLVREGATESPGHANVVALAKLLNATTREFAVAAVEWAIGVRAYEVVELVDGEAMPNRPTDKLIFTALPEIVVDKPDEV